MPANQITVYIDQALLSDSSQFTEKFNDLTAFFEKMPKVEQIQALTHHFTEGRNALHHLLVKNCMDPNKKQQFDLNRSAILAYLIAQSQILDISNYLSLKDETFGSTALHFAARNLDEISIHILLQAKSPIEYSNNHKTPADLLFDNHDHYEQLAICARIFIEYFKEKNLYIELRSLKQNLVNYVHLYFTNDRYYSARTHVFNALAPLLPEHEAVMSSEMRSQVTVIIDKLQHEHDSIRKSNNILKTKKWDVTIVSWMVHALTKLLREQGIDFHCDVLPTDEQNDAKHLSLWVNNLIEKLKQKEKLPQQFFVAVSSGAHWFPVVFMQEGDKLNIFILDSANNSELIKEYIRVLDNLKPWLNKFYNYAGSRNDTKDNKGIQTDEDSCSRFTLMHMMCMAYFSVSEQLATSPTKKLLFSDSDYRIFSESFEDKLAQLLIPLQSLTVANNLPDDILSSVIDFKGTHLLEEISKHIIHYKKANEDKIRYANQAIMAYMDFFEKLLISFLTGLSEPEFNMLKKQIEKSNLDPLAFNLDLWSSDKRKQLIYKIERISRLFVESGLGKNSQIIMLLAACHDQLSNHTLDNNALDSLERQVSQLMEKGMRQIKQNEKLILSIQNAIKAVTDHNASQYFSIWWVSIESQTVLLNLAKQSKDPDQIKTLIIDYLKNERPNLFGKLNLFTLSLLKQINHYPETRRVFLEAYRIESLATPQGAATFLETPEHPRDLDTDEDLQKLLTDLIHHKELFQSSIQLSNK